MHSIIVRDCCRSGTPGAVNIILRTSVLGPYSQCSIEVRPNPRVQCFAACLELVRVLYHTLLTLNTLSNRSVEIIVAANRL